MGTVHIWSCSLPHTTGKGTINKSPKTKKLIKICLCTQYIGMRMWKCTGDKCEKNAFSNNYEVLN